MGLVREEKEETKRLGFYTVDVIESSVDER